MTYRKFPSESCQQFCCSFWQNPVYSSNTHMYFAFLQVHFIYFPSNFLLEKVGTANEEGTVWNTTDSSSVEDLKEVGVEVGGESTGLLHAVSLTSLLDAVSLTSL